MVRPWASAYFAEVEVVHGEKGAPRLQLNGRAAEIFREKGGSEVFVSLSHEGPMAMASVIVSGP